MNLLEHGPDCVPLMPCAACEIVTWLRSKLAAEDFAELVARAKALTPPPKRSYRRRPAQASVAGNSRPGTEHTEAP